MGGGSWAPAALNGWWAQGCSPAPAAQPQARGLGVLTISKGLQQIPLEKLVPAGGRNCPPRSPNPPRERNQPLQDDPIPRPSLSLEALPSPAPALRLLPLVGSLLGRPPPPRLFRAPHSQQQRGLSEKHVNSVESSFYLPRPGKPPIGGSCPVSMPSPSPPPMAGITEPSGRSSPLSPNTAFGRRHPRTDSNWKGLNG